MSKGYTAAAKERLASSGSGLTNSARQAKAGVKSVFAQIPIHNKIGLGLGVTSLGVSLASLNNNLANRQANEAHQTIEQKSLQALNKIHKALATEPKI